MNILANKSICLACSVLKGEIEATCEEGILKMPVLYMESMLHMRPKKLGGILETNVMEALNTGKKVLLCYGDCFGGMAALIDRPGVWRLPGRNCVEIIIGKEAYRERMRAKAFFILPEWAARWREVFAGQLGLDENTARELMRENHSELLYIDTGLTPVPTEDLNQMSDYIGLPWRGWPVGLDNLKMLMERIQVEMEDYKL